MYVAFVIYFSVHLVLVVCPPSVYTVYTITGVRGQPGGRYHALRFWQKTRGTERGEKRGRKGAKRLL